MKRIILALAICTLAAPAWAACAVTNLQVKDNAAVTAAVPYADDGSGGSNCSPQIQIKQGGNVATVSAAGELSVKAASGALASGAGTDGWDATQGAKADAACGTDNGTCSIAALVKRTNQNLTTLNTTAGSAVPAGTARIGYVSDDPCAQAIKISSPISITSPASLSVIAAGVSAKKTYVCSLALIAGSAGTVSLIEGTGNACAGSPVAVLGSTTAAGGMSLAANGGLTLGGGNGTVAATATNANNLCAYGFTGTIAGVLTLVQQ